MMEMYFEQVARTHLPIIFNWLSEAHVIKYWDNSLAHKKDIIHFTKGRKIRSNYADGKYVYWIGFIGSSDSINTSLMYHPFSMLMTIQETSQSDINEEKLSRLSKTGHTYGIDYMIGNPQFFNKGYGSKTLSAFLDFFKSAYDIKADTFFIDPDSVNTRAKHVYLKAGFVHACDFMMKGNVSGKGRLHHLLVKQLKEK